MADVQITCINKIPRQDPHEGITHLGGPAWRWTRQVVDSINSGTNSFYTRRRTTGKRRRRARPGRTLCQDLRGRSLERQPARLAGVQVDLALCVPLALSRGAASNDPGPLRIQARGTAEGSDSGLVA